MSRMNKRALENLDEDPDDDDYESQSPARKRSKKITSGRGHKSKKRRGRYMGSDIEVDEDEEETSEDDDIVGDSGPSSPTLVNPNTGRTMRRAAKPTTYQDPDSDEDLETVVETKEDTDAEEMRNLDSVLATHNIRTGRKSLIVKLKSPGLMASRGFESDEKSSIAAKSRRSSRIPHPEDIDLVSLTPSGIQDRLEMPESVTPEPASIPRHVRGAKRKPNTANTLEDTNELDDAENSYPQGSGMIIGIPPEDVVELGFESKDKIGEPPPAPTSDAQSLDGEHQDDDDEGPLIRKRTRTRTGIVDSPLPQSSQTRKGGRLARRGRVEEEDSSDFEPPGEDLEDDDDLSNSETSPRKDSQRSEASSSGRRSGRIAPKGASQRRAATSERTGDEAEEVAEELADLQESQREGRRKRKRSLEDITYEAPRRRARADRLDYTIRPEMWPTGEEDDVPIIQSVRASRGGKSGGAYRSIWNTQGPFGFAGGPPPKFKAPGAFVGPIDSDSSDDEVLPRAARGIGGNLGLTPTSAVPSMPMFAQFNEPTHGASSGPPNLGKIINKKALADADPLGIDQNVNFTGVGGLESHINQLKEMVLLPLLYPEVFARFHVTPPRGVLFHGPPGTGKTLLARALANSVSLEGRKVTFYMRKGADALSKYVGEAERQLRLLFEDARKNQPSIIFFDEIDGLAPVRSSKQDQIHATIVTTMLALMDGMDGRGQVIVIGATNRPDTVDSALRRPGRFDREFYFPLPDVKARRAIIDIHTAGWEPPLKLEFKDQLASLTNGYGGADLRALCTEAALNAVQGTYPQIYQSTDKLLIDPKTIKVLAKDFMISVNKMIPSSQRATASNAAPLDSRVEPLLRDALKAVSERLDEVLPQIRKLSALEEAEYDDRDDVAGFERELMQQAFDQGRVFRPRMLVYGPEGMGQQLIGQALLHKFERLHVQNFDLSVLFSDSARSPQAAVVQLFTEARRHKPSVIFIPDIEIWYQTVEPSVIKLFLGLLQSLPPNEPILLLATLKLEKDQASPDPELLRGLFGFSSKSQFRLVRPNEPQRREFFLQVVDLIRTAPSSFPDLENRKKRQIVRLEKAPVPEQKLPNALSKEHLRAQKKADRACLNMLKIKLGLIMDQLKNSFKMFRRPPIEPDLISYLFDQEDPTMVTTDIADNQSDANITPYVVDKDDKGVGVIRETATGRTFYNLELVTIERRLSNGYYKRPKDFVADIKRLNKDAKTLGDTDKILKSNLMLANVEVDVNMMFDVSDPALTAECENVYLRELERARLEQDRPRAVRSEALDIYNTESNVPQHASTFSAENSGPVVLGQKVPGQSPVPVPAQLRHFRGNSLSNGLSQDPGQEGFDMGHSASVTRDADEDVEMSNSQDEPTLAPREASATLPPKAYSQLSQKTFITPMVPGSQAQEYHNSASTTTSEQKTSKSRSSGQNTQSTNGLGPWTEKINLDLDISGGSQLPDTQEINHNSQSAQSPPPMQSGPSHASQCSPVPLSQHSPFPDKNRRGSSINMLLNEVVPPVDSAAKPKLILDDVGLKEMYDSFVSKSSGLSVEQLEQMNARLMDVVWKSRANWNRTQVTFQARDAFNETIADIEKMQGILDNSQEETV